MERIHKSVAQTLRYAGYNAKCIFNISEPQPFEVHVKNVSNAELNTILDLIWKMYKDTRINIIAA